jgi:hypothetical protein
MFWYTRCTRVHADGTGLARQACPINAFPNPDYQSRGSTKAILIEKNLLTLSGYLPTSIVCAIEILQKHTRRTRQRGGWTATVVCTPTNLIFLDPFRLRPYVTTRSMLR